MKVECAFVGKARNDPLTYSIFLRCRISGKSFAIISKWNIAVAIRKPEKTN